MNPISFLRSVLLILILGALVLASIFAPRELQAHLLELKQFVHAHALGAVFAFFGLYLLSMMMVFFPVAVLTLLGGFLFGPVLGGVCNLLGSLMCAVLAFLSARYFIADFVRERAGVKVNVMMEGVSREGWRFVALIRLIPILPFHILNAVLGLTRLQLGEYTLATLIFMMPVKLTYTYIGSLGEDFVRNPEQVSIGKLIIGITLIMGATLLPWVIKKIRKF